MYGPYEMDRGKEGRNWKDERDVRDTEKFQGSNPWNNDIVHAR